MKPLPVPLVFHPLLVLAFAVFAVVFAAGVDVAVPAKDSAAGNNNPQSVINRPGKYGFVDTEGRLLIACQWDYAQGFSNDMARVEKMASGDLSIGKVSSLCPAFGITWVVFGRVIGQRW